MRHSIQRSNDCWFAAYVALELYTTINMEDTFNIEIKFSHITISAKRSNFIFISWESRCINPVIPSNFIFICRPYIYVYLTLVYRHFFYQYCLVLALLIIRCNGNERHRNHYHQHISVCFPIETQDMIAFQHIPEVIIFSFGYI